MNHSKSISNNHSRSVYDRPRLVRRSSSESSHRRRHRSRSLSKCGRKCSRSWSRSNERYRSPFHKRFPSYRADNSYSRGRGRRDSPPEERDRSWRGCISLYDYNEEKSEGRNQEEGRRDYQDVSGEILTYDN